jgi:hypothetical protein
MGRVLPALATRTAGALDGPDAVVSPLRARADPDPGHGREAAASLGGAGPPGTHTLALEGTFDWGDDLLVALSPTLRRDGAARRKLFPRGLVAMHPTDGQAMGIRTGWSVRLRSPVGEALVPVTLSARVEPGVLLVDYGFRAALAPVLGDRAAQRVEVERT